MMKKERKTAYAVLRRGMAFLCTLVLALMAVTLPASAAVEGNLADKTIVLSGGAHNEGTKGSGRAENDKRDGGSSWVVVGSKTIQGTVKPKEWYNSRKNMFTCYEKANSTLTITNKSGKECRLTFSYTVPKNGTLSFSPKSSTTNGPYTTTLQNNTSVTVTLTTPNTDWQDGRCQEMYTVTTTLSDINLEPLVENVSVTLATPTNGSYTATANGEELRVGDIHNMPRNTEYRFSAVPNPGYNFVGWYVDDHKLSSKLEFTTSFNENCTVVARFVSKGVALFETGDQLFDDLNDAVTYAQANRQQKITLEISGAITGHYMIPAGITLLIPFDEAKTLYTNEPGYVNKEEAQKAHRILTMAPNSSITVDGAISVGGKHFAGSSGSCCKATGPYGQIIMQEGSRITLNNHANLYAWGYITGDGQITANSGATVYEYFQVADWRGGIATSSMILPPNKQQVFPFSQYYVQNIEAPLTIQNGATEKAYFSVDAAIVGTNSVTIDFIGSNTSLFRINEGGELTKKYDPKTDRITYTTKGSASLDSLALSVPGYNIDSKNYVLPVNSNMTLEILSGKVAVNCDAALLPGARITIARGAELSVSTNTSLYVYDKDQWNGPYVYASKENGFVPVPYTPTPKGSRTLANAKIDVNGTLTAAGSVYTTDSGADICSSEGSGKFVQKNTPGTETKTYQVTKQAASLFGSTEYDEIPITPAQLLNKDGSYTPTAGSKASDTFTYCKCQECGGGTWVKNLMVAEFKTTQYGTLQEAANAANGAPYVRLLHSTTGDINAQRDLYLDLNGYTVTGNFKMNGYTLNGMDSTTDGYDGTNAGKIVGSVNPYNKITYQTGNPGDAYKRYVGILREENGTPTLSFHRFNISVTGYRFELAAPQCALIFRGEFRGDDEAKKHLKSLGFTLTDKDGKSLGTDSSPITDPKDIPKESEPGESKVVLAEDGAFLFELYLIRSFEKNSSDKTAYTEEFSATAQAAFKNGGTQDSGTKDSEPQHLSFKEAWLNALSAPDTDKNKKILQNFLDEFGIKIQAE